MTLTLMLFGSYPIMKYVVCIVRNLKIELESAKQNSRSFFIHNQCFSPTHQFLFSVPMNGDIRKSSWTFEAGVLVSPINHHPALGINHLSNQKPYFLWGIVRCSLEKDTNTDTITNSNTNIKKRYKYLARKFSQFEYLRSLSEKSHTCECNAEIGIVDQANHTPANLPNTFDKFRFLPKLPFLLFLSRHYKFWNGRQMRQIQIKF